MQQLVERRVKPNTPIGTSLACSSVVLSLNKEETLSEQNSKTSTNNLEVKALQYRGEQNPKVSVIAYTILEDTQLEIAISQLFPSWGDTKQYIHQHKAGDLLALE